MLTFIPSDFNHLHGYTVMLSGLARVTLFHTEDKGHKLLIPHHANVLLDQHWKLTFVTPLRVINCYGAVFYLIILDVRPPKNLMPGCCRLPVFLILNVSSWWLTWKGVVCCILRRYFLPAAGLHWEVICTAVLSECRTFSLAIKNTFSVLLLVTGFWNWYSLVQYLSLSMQAILLNP